MTMTNHSILTIVLTLSFALNAYAKETARIVFLAGKPSHGYGEHEHSAGCRLLADTIQRSTNGNVKCDVYQNGWPEDDRVLQGADTIVMYCDGGGGHPALGHLEALDKLIQSGVGFVCIHYGVEVPTDRGGPEFLNWLGGYFETHWSVNPHWVADYTSLPDHEVTRGVTPFRANDEWYFHMRFREGMAGVTPILSAVPPADTMRRPDGPHSGNPAVRKEVAERVPQHTAWVFERPDGGRSFGFTGGHFHWNWGREEILRLVSNAIVWTAKFDVPEGGLPVLRPTIEKLEEGQDLPQPKQFDRDRIKDEFKVGAYSRHDPVLGALRTYDGVEVTLAADQPTLRSPTCLDVDHRGRVWLCEVMNYRAHRNSRPEGDRILILEDENGDGVMDKSKVFYQGRDIDSAMGICVLGNKTIVSASPNIWIFTDDDGDDVPDHKELLFSKTGDPQHDHSAHSFVFGPDGKLYWNFGNSGNSVHDAKGSPIVDLSGNTVVDNGKPYYGGMVFRCNLDGSQFEVLAHNFRNNYEVCVDAFGTMWQSDNDDDGHKATRINYVMDYGNFGYRDELTGAGWQAPRTNLEDTEPHRHWHLNDPGVVPTMLITGAGSPSGMTFYEGSLLPQRFRNQVIHCEPGTGVVRAYPTEPSGAGYAATIEKLFWEEGDDRFRPVDVCTAPDGSLFIADWYDPGVGGHLMGDLDRGRVFRLAPVGSRYVVAKNDLTTPVGAVAGLLSPNQATRYLAWQAITGLGKAAQVELEKLISHDDPRVRARAYWALGKLSTGGRKNVVASALSDPDANVRCMAIRLARQLDVPAGEYFVKVLGDSSPAVRREMALALHLDRSPEMPSLWAALAVAYPGDDRWYVEALGIGAERHWGECFSAYAARMSERKQSPHPDIVWRARTPLVAPYLTQILADAHVSASEVNRSLRALDYHPESTRNEILAAVGKSFLGRIEDADQWSDAQKLIFAELLIRVPDGKKWSSEPMVQSFLQTQMSLKQSRQLRLDLLTRLSVTDAQRWLAELICESGLDSPAIAAAQTLMEQLGSQPVRAVLNGRSELDVAKLVEAFAAVRPSTSRSTLVALVKDKSLPDSARAVAAKGLTKSQAGENDLLELMRSGLLPRESYAVVGSALRTSKNAEVNKLAHELFPPPKSKSGVGLPELSALVQMHGDPLRGAEIYQKTATCAKCHPLDPNAKSVGPSLTEIGDKLGKEAMYVSILDPSAGISHNYEAYSALNVDGQVITGLLISQTDTSVILRDNEGLDHQLVKSDLEEFKKLDKSLMPDNMADLLTAQELVDLVEYLVSLRK